MSVMLEMFHGDRIIDLKMERCPTTRENVLKLCKMKYYALNTFSMVRRGLGFLVSNFEILEVDHI